jgi:hypothetical protein
MFERETEMPDAGLVRFRDAETGRQMWVDTSDRRIRENYRMWYINHHEAVNDLFLRSGVDVAKIRTDQDYVKPLVTMFKKREARR